MHDKVKAFLVAHGVPQAVIDKVDAIGGHAKDILWMFVTDGEQAAINFINEEYAKVKNIITASV